MECIVDEESSACFLSPIWVPGTISLFLTAAWHTVPRSRSSHSGHTLNNPGAPTTTLGAISKPSPILLSIISLHLSQTRIMADPFDSALDLLRRLNPKDTAKNLSSICQIAPSLTEELLESVDVPLGVKRCKTGRDFLTCDYNRDGDSWRSPWNNEFYPPLDDGEGVVPTERVRKMEVRANEAFDVYRELYVYRPAPPSSTYYIVAVFVESRMSFLLICLLAYTVMLQTDTTKAASPACISGTSTKASLAACCSRTHQSLPRRAPAAGIVYMFSRRWTGRVQHTISLPARLY
jgi:hypothetical protein